MPLLKEELAGLMEHAGTVKVDLPASYAIVLIGQLQLALRHQPDDRAAARMACEMIDAIRNELPLESQLIIEMGFDPSYDDRSILTLQE